MVKIRMNGLKNDGSTPYHGVYSI